MRRWPKFAPGHLADKWLPSHHTIDAGDLAIAATAQIADLSLLTMNVRHFPMFEGLTAPRSTATGATKGSEATPF